MYKKIQTDLQSLSDTNRATKSARFFKTNKGEYGAGDVFVGITMPKLRTLAKQYYQTVTFSNIEKLLASPIHEYRMLGLLFLVYKYKKVASQDKKTIYNYYVKHITCVNNWDLVDVTAPHIVGDYLVEIDAPQQLYVWAKKDDLWLQRIAIISTFSWIRVQNFEPTLKVSKLLLAHPHDLIHKAVGWMLREVGKRDQKKLYGFLDVHAIQMPRTMLRYAIERVPDTKRRYYLTLKKTT